MVRSLSASDIAVPFRLPRLRLRRYHDLRDDPSSEVGSVSFADDRPTGRCGLYALIAGDSQPAPNSDMQNTNGGSATTGRALYIPRSSPPRRGRDGKRERSAAKRSRLSLERN